MNRGVVRNVMRTAALFFEYQSGQVKTEKIVKEETTGLR